MKERDKKFIEKWSKTREKGKFNFMIKSGLLFGLFTVIFMQLLKLDEMSFRELFLSKFFVVNLLIHMVIGVFVYGYVMWLFAEKRTKISQANFSRKYLIPYFHHTFISILIRHKKSVAHYLRCFYPKPVIYTFLW